MSTMGNTTSDGSTSESLRTGGNDHVWECEHRHPTATQVRAMGSRRADAESKLAQHLKESQEAEHPVEAPADQDIDDGAPASAVHAEEGRGQGS